MDHHIKIPQKVSGRLVSKKPISLSRAAKLITRFAAVENGSSPAVSIYLQRTADAFNHLVQSREKRSKGKSVQTEEHSEKVEQEIVNGGDAAAEAPAKRNKKKRMSDEDNLEKDSESLARETKTEIVKTPKKKKTKKSGEGSSDSKSIQKEKDSENLAREIKTEIINGGDAAEAPSKKKKKKKKKKSGESGSKK